MAILCAQSANEEVNELRTKGGGLWQGFELILGEADAAAILQVAKKCNVLSVSASLASSPSNATTWNFQADLDVICLVLDLGDRRCFASLIAFGSNFLAALWGVPCQESHHQLIHVFVWAAVPTLVAAALYSMLS